MTAALMKKQHPVSIIGAAITTLSAVAFIFVLLMDWLGLHTNPYLGILFFFVIPTFFVLGLLMIPAGMWLTRRRQAKGLEAATWPSIDLNNPIHRRRILLFATLTLVNLLIVSLAAFKGIEYMDTPSFCGRVCHTVMEPEYVAHQAGPHSRVPCTDCHVGEGAGYFIKAKLNGLRQVVSLTRGTYPRPVPSPVHNLRPARDTCEHCHWPEKFHGDKVEVVYEYGSDEKNTETITRLIVHVGGGSDRLGVKSGIHWHMNVANEIEYVATDEKRETIPYVRMKDAKGNVREYRVDGVTDDQLAKGERRRMDCLDCHNRPTHMFSATPERAVDGAISRGEISRDLPFARREAVAVLKGEYPDTAAAQQQIDQKLKAFYGQNYASLVPAHAADIDNLVRATQRLYERNVFPYMKVTWGTHPNHLGHTDSTGCFRCHDDQHKTADGRVIKQDCDQCHAMPE